MSITQMSISAGLLVIAIVLIRAVALNRLPKTMFLALWGVALCRLLIPVSIPLGMGVYNPVGELVKRISPDKTSLTLHIPPTAENVLPVNEQAAIAAAAAGTTQTVEAEPEQTFNMSPRTIIWLVGMFAVFALLTVIYLKTHRKLRFALPIRDNDFLNGWLKDHRLLRPIAIMQSDRITVPAAVGLLKPRIVLPKYMDMSDKQLLSYVLAHEYCHIKRFDALWKLLLGIALCVHWFNPLVWIIFILANRDMELTCDEMVLRRFGAKTKTDYAYSIIGMFEQRSGFALLHSGFSKNAVEERIESIMKMKKASFVSVFSAFVVVSALTAGVLTVSASSTAESEAEAENLAWEYRPKPKAKPIPSNYVDSADYQANITAVEAQGIALAGIGGGTVARTEIKYPPHGGIEYKVIVVDGEYKYDVDVDVHEGTIRNSRMEPITKTGPGVYDASGVIGADRAKSIAVERAGGGLVTDCHLENRPHEGITVYHIHVASGQYEHCVELDAVTGSIVAYELRDPTAKPSPKTKPKPITK